MNSDTDTVIVPPHVLCRLVGHEAVLLDLQSGLYFGLDRVGTQMWTLLAEGRTQREVATSVAGEYDVDPARVHADLAALVATLRDRGLLEA